MVQCFSNNLTFLLSFKVEPFFLILDSSKLDLMGLKVVSQNHFLRIAAFYSRSSVSSFILVLDSEIILSSTYLHKLYLYKCRKISLMFMLKSNEPKIEF